MQSLGRLFGRQLINHPESYVSKQPARLIRNNIRSQSFCGNQKKMDYVPNRQNINPNISLKIQKPSLAKPKAKQVQNNKQNLTDYFDESICFILAQQQKTKNLVNYFTKQTQITQSMRVTLIDWIVDIHHKYKMFPRTLYLTVSILDKYLSLKNIKKIQFQLIGAACLFIAAKYQQTYHVPESYQLVQYSDRAFSKNQLFKAEADIIKTLQFNFIFNTIFNFFDPFATVTNLDARKYCHCQYLLELSLMSVQFNKYKPSLMAASVIYLINKINNKIKKQQNCWPDILVAASGYVQSDLKQCARQLCTLLQHADKRNDINNLKRKFTSSKYMEVARIRLQKIQKRPN